MEIIKTIFPETMAPYIEYPIPQREDEDFCGMSVKVAPIMFPGTRYEWKRLQLIYDGHASLYIRRDGMIYRETGCRDWSIGELTVVKSFLEQFYGEPVIVDIDRIKQLPDYNESELDTYENYLESYKARELKGVHPLFAVTKAHLPRPWWRNPSKPFKAVATT